MLFGQMRLLYSSKHIMNFAARRRVRNLVINHTLSTVPKFMKISKNHNSLDCEQSLGIDIKQSPSVQDAFRPIPGLIGCAGVIRNVGVIHRWLALYSRPCSAAVSIVCLQHFHLQNKKRLLLLCKPW